MFASPRRLCCFSSWPLFAFLRFHTRASVPDSRNIFPASGPCSDYVKDRPLLAARLHCARPLLSSRMRATTFRTSTECTVVAVIPVLLYAARQLVDDSSRDWLRPSFCSIPLSFLRVCGHHPSTLLYFVWCWFVALSRHARVIGSIRRAPHSPSRSRLGEYIV